MTKPLIQIGDDVREMTDQEFADHQKYVAEEINAFNARAAIKASARAKLAALGLTDDEITALVG